MFWCYIENDYRIESAEDRVTRSWNGRTLVDKPKYKLDNGQFYNTLIFKFNDDRLSKLENDMDLHIDTLSSEQTSNLIANLGLQPICSMIVSNGDAEKPLSQVEGMDIKSLKVFLNKFDSFLIAPEDYLLVQIKLLTSSAHRKSISKRSLQLVSATYKQLYEAVVDPKNAYNNPELIVNKTPDQVDLLLHL